MGDFCCHENQSFDPICPKTFCSLSPLPVILHIKFDQDWPTGLRDIQVRKCKIFVIQGQVTPKWVVWSGLMQLSPTPMMLHIKFDQDWPTRFRDIQVRKCNIFVIQGQVTPKWVVWFGPKSNSSELLCLSWLPATLVMNRSKINDLAWRQHFPIISLWKLFSRSRAANSVVSGPIWPKLELVRDFMHVLVTCKYK